MEIGQSIYGKEDYVMSYVLTNGKYYIKMTDTGATVKTNDINEARVYLTIDKAKERMQKAPKKTKGYYIFDLDTQSKYYMTKGRIKFPREIRELIYHNADGRYILCGRKIIYDDMTLDHVTPLAMGGHDSVENLACTCRACNLFKGSVLPSDFMERITNIFLYQMERRHKGSISWKIVHKILSKMI